MEYEDNHENEIFTMNGTFNAKSNVIEIYGNENFDVSQDESYMFHTVVNGMNDPHASPLENTSKLFD